MKLERAKRLVADTLASGFGAAGMYQQIFLRDKPDVGLVLLFLGILLFPGALAVFSLRSTGNEASSGGNEPTTGSGPSSPPPSQPQPSSPSSSS